VKIRVSARARREADRAEAWWRANRSDAADLLTRELLHVLDLLRDNPNLGTLYNAAHFDGPLRRILMKKTQQHVYHGRLNDEVIILAVWVPAENAARSCKPFSL
jgi:plasmid stabilization system protein ParE